MWLVVLFVAVVSSIFYGWAGFAGVTCAYIALLFSVEVIKIVADSLDRAIESFFDLFT